MGRNLPKVESARVIYGQKNEAKTILNGFWGPETSAGLQRPLAGLYSGFLVADSRFNILNCEEPSLVKERPTVYLKRVHDVSHLEHYCVILLIKHYSKTRHISRTYTKKS